MGIILISSKLLRAAYKETKSETIMHGVFQKKGRGIPNFVVKEDYTKDIKSDKIRGEKKDSVLEGCVDCPDLVEFSVYETKPVNFLYMEA